MLQHEHAATETGQTQAGAARTFDTRIERYRQRVERELEHWLPATGPGRSALHEAMRYATLGGGKRLRPLLVYAAGELCGTDPTRLDAIAAAVELVHAYSLVHDDLPAMDDDTLRRGRPTVHVAYGEATAILAGDALQTLAFGILAGHPAFRHAPGVRCRLIGLIAESIGSRGMVGGQALDLAFEQIPAVGRVELEDMFERKTGRLIYASIVMPTLAGPPLPDGRRPALEAFALAIGAAFQIRDDLLEIGGSADKLGKNTDSDERNGKASYPALFGAEQARHRAGELGREARRALASLGPGSEGLAYLARLIVSRDH